MPDVLYDGARSDYDVAHEVFGEVVDGDIVGVACYPVDTTWDGTPTGVVDPLPVRVYVLDDDGDMAGEPGKALTAYMTLDAARELRETIDAAITYVELVRHRRRRGGPLRGGGEAMKVRVYCV